MVRLAEGGLRAHPLVADLVGGRVERDRALILLDSPPDRVTPVAFEQVAVLAQQQRAGLGLAPDDRNLIYDRGEVKAATGDPAGALADWRRALELDPADLSPVYASAFLLEREGRLAEAAESWRYIVEYCDVRGWELTAAWPRQELQRLRGLLGGHQDPGR